MLCLRINKEFFKVSSIDYVFIERKHLEAVRHFNSTVYDGRTSCKYNLEVLILHKQLVHLLTATHFFLFVVSLIGLLSSTSKQIMRLIENDELGAEAGQSIEFYREFGFKVARIVICYKMHMSHNRIHSHHLGLGFKNHI